MSPPGGALGFLHWVGVTHYLNLLFVGFLLRSGLEIFSAHPKLYWNDGCRPGTEWLKLTRKRMPTDRLWTAMDEEVEFSWWFALPGKSRLGMGRHWHFACALFWLLNGLVYVVLLFSTGEWQRLMPTSWSIFPEAVRTAEIYFRLQLPPPGHPYNALQQLAYAGVVFVLPPLLLLTGAAMSPAIAARFPWYLRIFRGRQSARSIHFICLVALLAFIVAHVTLVAIEDFPRHMSWIIRGDYDAPRVSVIVGMAGLVAVLLLHVAATWFSLRHPRRVQRILGGVTEPVRRALLHHVVSRQAYTKSDVSPFFRVNGYPPTSREYQELSSSRFEHWRLRVHGLVEVPLELSLSDLRAMPSSTQITLHHCIQGWSAVAEWTGVAVAEVMSRCKPLPSARYLLLRGFDEPIEGRTYYESLDLELARHPQTLLAYAMNGESLPIPYGAPCRLRAETQLGFKMVKYLHSIELVESYREIGDGQGGYREDVQFYGSEAGI